MKKGKKILSGILAASMLMTMTACGGDDTSSSADTSSADNAVQAEDTGSDAGAQSEDTGSEAGTQKDYSEKITVSWAEVIEGDEGIDYTQDDVYKTVQEKFNLDIEVTPLTWVTGLRIFVYGSIPEICRMLSTGTMYIANLWIMWIRGLSESLMMTGRKDGLKRLNCML